MNADTLISILRGQATLFSGDKHTTLLALADAVESGTATVEWATARWLAL